MFKIILAQLNFCVGDIQGNTIKIIEAIKKAKIDLADMIIFSELTLTGYPPEDLLFYPDLYEEIEEALKKIREVCSDSYVVLGYPEKIGDDVFNVAEVIFQGKSIAKHQKMDLPNYGVFDEKRYFKSGSDLTLFDFHGIKTGLLICEDIWGDGPLQKTVALGAQWIIVINASPYHDQKYQARKKLIEKYTTEYHIPIVYVNQVGGQDELIFDGQSFVMNAQGEICAQAAHAEEALLSIEMISKNPPTFKKETMIFQLDRIEEIYKALVLAVKDYVNKNGFKQVFLGLSGGIDSALVLTIAVDALGPDRVTAITMPSPYTAYSGVVDSHQLANVLGGVKIIDLPIDDTFSLIKSILHPLLNTSEKGVTEQNIQARIRAIFLMAFANKFHGLVLTTSNKSEVAVGYSTLYGDMAGGFDVLKDVYKTEVYQLAHYRNKINAVIPERIITRLPTAELAPEQTDQDELPPYEILDALLKLFIEKNESEEKIIEQGFDEKLVKKIIRLITLNEYKRRQSPIGPKVTTRAFGKDWRFPITKHAT